MEKLGWKESDLLELCDKAEKEEEARKWEERRRPMKARREKRLAKMMVKLDCRCADGIGPSLELHQLFEGIAAPLADIPESDHEEAVDRS